MPETVFSGVVLVFFATVKNRISGFLAVVLASWAFAACLER